MQGKKWFCMKGAGRVVLCLLLAASLTIPSVRVYALAEEAVALEAEDTIAAESYEALSAEEDEVKTEAVEEGQQNNPALEYEDTVIEPEEDLISPEEIAKESDILEEQKGIDEPFEVPAAEEELGEPEIGISDTEIDLLGTNGLSIDDWEYEISSDKKSVILKKYQGSGKDITVNASYQAGGKTYKTILQGTSAYAGSGSGEDGTQDEYDEGLLTFPADTESVTVKKGVKAAASIRGLFQFLGALKSVDIKGMDTSATENMRDLFYNCSALEEVDMSGMNVTGVTDMAFMFRSCHALSALNISKWNPSKLTNTEHMFAGCNNLASIEGFDALYLPKLENMRGMFQNCSRLKKIAFFSKKKIMPVDVSRMLEGCKNLVSLDLSGLDLRNVTSCEEMLGYVASSPEDEKSTDLTALTSIVTPINVPVGVEIILPGSYLDYNSFTYYNTLPTGKNSSLSLQRSGAEEPVAVSLTLNESEISLEVGETRTISGTIQPATFFLSGCDWVSGNPEAVSIRGGKSSGSAVTATVRGTAEGTSIVTASFTTESGETISSSCQVTVSPAEEEEEEEEKEEEEPVPVESVVLSKTYLELSSGQEYYLVAKVLPENADSQEISWSYGGSGASVEPNGNICKITALRPSENTMTYITASCDGDSAECEVLINAAAYAVKNYDDLPSGMTATITVGQKINMFDYTGDTKKVAKEGWQGNTYFFKGPTTYLSDNPGIAKHDGRGNITGVSGGTATIQWVQVLNTHYGQSTHKLGKSYNVFVLSPPQVLESSVTLNDIGAIYSGANNVTTGYPEYRPDSWNSSKPSVAEVSDEGLVTAKSGGTTVISANFGSKSASFTVKVNAPKMSISKTSATVLTGGSLKLSIKGVPKGEQVFWASSDPSTALVDQSGTVTPILPGEASIYGIAAGHAYSCAVSIPEIALSSESFKIKKPGGSVTVTFNGKTTKLKPADFLWTSENEAVCKPVKEKDKQTGKFIGKSYGTAVVTGVYAKNQAIVVQAKIEVPVVNKTSLTLPFWGSENIGISTITDGRVVGFVSSNEKIACVDAKGRVTGIRPGTTEINAVVQLDEADKAVIYYPCEVTVLQPKLKLQGGYTMKRGKSVIVEFDAKTCSPLAAARAVLEYDTGRFSDIVSVSRIKNKSAVRLKGDSVGMTDYNFCWEINEKPIAETEVFTVSVTQ
ncbi:MAG: Ig-like domain-containing protein [Lachnospiraceae bacterium]|nr:Ig-like domain-containing protein [Lachnospiraceae bacterium]